MIRIFGWEIIVRRYLDEPNEKYLNEVRWMWEQGGQISAIKHYRDWFVEHGKQPPSLKEAKEFCEKLSQRKDKI